MTITTLPFRFRPEDIEAARNSGRRSLPIFVFVLWAAAVGLVVGGGAAAVVASGLRDTRFELATGELAGWLAFALTVAVLAHFGHRADTVMKAKDETGVPESRVIFDETGVRLTNEHVETTFFWPGLASAMWRDDDLILTCRTGVRLIVPGRTFSDPADLAAVRALIDTRITA
jgi:hypothetical protein